jgi:predicted aspartyl protease
MPRYGSVCMMLVLAAVLPASVANAEDGYAVVPMARGNHLHLFAPVSVNGSKIMWFLVDTGFPRSLISPDLGRALPVPSIITEQSPNFLSIGSSTRIVYARSVKSMDMELGPGFFVQKPIAFSAEKTNEVRIAFNKEGILGMDLLSKHGAVINCRTQQIFFSRTGSNLPLPRQGFEEMGLTYVPIRITPEGYVEVEGTINGIEYSFLVDTGAFWTTLDPEVQQKSHLPIVRRGTGTLPYYGQSHVPFVMARLPDFKIGDYEVKNQILCFASIHRPPGGTLHKWGGLIGADLLFNHHAVIDLGNRGLYLMADKKK